MTEMHFDCCGGAFEAVFAQANYTKVLAKSYTTLVSVQVSQAPAAGPGFMWTSAATASNINYFCHLLSVE